MGRIVLHPAPHTDLRARVLVVTMREHLRCMGVFNPVAMLAGACNDDTARCASCCRLAWSPEFAGHPAGWLCPVVEEPRHSKSWTACSLHVGMHINCRTRGRACGSCARHREKGKR